jgi:hypothetical protein
MEDRSSPGLFNLIYRSIQYFTRQLLPATLEIVFTVPTSTSGSTAAPGGGRGEGNSILVEDMLLVLFRVEVQVAAAAQPVRSREEQSRASVRQSADLSEIA